MRFISVFVVLFILHPTVVRAQVVNDTAKNVAYLKKSEKAVIRILNEARTDPPAFAKKHLKGNSTFEAKECYREMLAMKPLKPLLPSKALTMVATSHAIDMGLTGQIGHIGSNGARLEERVERCAIWYGALSENCSYGHDDPLSIVLQLLIDQGISGRGHRKNILDKDVRYVGVSIQPHNKYIHNCVMNFAGKVKSKY